MQIFLFLALLIAIALIFFALQNSALVTVNFLAFHFEGSLAFILIVVFASGVLTGILMAVPSFWKKSSALREQRRKIKQLEESVAMKPASKAKGKKEADTDY
jgi:uncharacterized integral membrane protein